MFVCVGVLFLLLQHVLVLGLKRENGFKYEAPDDCQWRSVKSVSGADEVSLNCKLRTINSDIDSTNFSVIPAEHTTSLIIQCTPELNAKSTLPERSFAHLNRLREFSLQHCKLAKLPSGALIGLPDLRNLSVQTFDHEFSLEISSDVFVPIKQLEKLELSHNNFWSLPEGLFCPLVNLVSLNVSHNHLQDIDDFGFRSARNRDDDLTEGTITFPVTTPSDNSGKRLCGLDIQVLDVSHNSFGHIPARSLSALRRLHELKITDNGLSSLSDRALNGLKNLRIFDVSNNKLVALPPTLFSDCNDVRELHFQNNSLGTLAPGLLSGLKHLLSLDLSKNRLSSSWMDSNTFSGLIRLVQLDLSYNRITNLNPDYFKDLYTLQILNLEHNLLETLPANTFAPMNNLHTLVLSYNRLDSLEASSFSGLFALSLLALDNNVIENLHEEALKNCTALQDLNMNGNNLTTVPAALNNLRLLRTLDLGENSLEQLEQPAFTGMNNLYGLRLIGNKLTNLSRRAFAELPTLQILNVARNKIEKIEIGTFDLNTNLQAIRLDANSIVDITGLFSKLPNLVWLNISDNRLNYFDYSLIPSSLQWLDLHKNKIKEIGDTKRKLSEIKLQTLDVSYNLLSRVSGNSLPASSELIFLNDNQITTVEPLSFLEKPNLTRVDLYANQIVSMEMSALRLTPVNEERQLPEFYIGGNPFKCDCSMEWLQRINSLDHLRQQPRVLDLEGVYCKLAYSRNKGGFVALLEADSAHLVCPYESHCFALCHCCEFDACDCKMTCPNNCSCYHDQSWSAANIVDCSLSNHSRLPTRIPMDATEVYLDGNSFGDLTSHLFIGRKNLRVLYVNSSKVNSVHNHTFSGLKRLQILHLEDNYLRELRGFELACLEELRELYLQNNRLHTIDNRTFIELKNLEVLRLDGNRLHNFPVSQLTANPYLARITLSDNNWSCHCEYMRDFRAWFKVNLAKVTDHLKVTCVLRVQEDHDKTISKQLGPHLADFNSTSCASYLMGGGYLDSEYDENSVTIRAIRFYLPLMFGIITAFILAVCVIFAAAYHRKRLRLWMYSRCGVKICYFANNHTTASSSALEELEERARQFDAYLTYSTHDEGFVIQALVSSLEPQLRLCLQHRDCANSSVSLLELLESSRRTILVLSAHFLVTEWRRPELRSALKEAIQRETRKKHKNNRLIVINLGEVPSRDLDPDLRVHLSKAVCIKWGDKRFWQKLRVALPDRRKSEPDFKQSLSCCTRDSVGVRPSSSMDSNSHVYEYSSIVSPPHDYYETIGEPHLSFLSPPRISTLRREQQQSLWA